jgi:hypothetical protein
MSIQGGDLQIRVALPYLAFSSGEKPEKPVSYNPVYQDLRIWIGISGKVS